MSPGGDVNTRTHFPYNHFTPLRTFFSPNEAYFLTAHILSGTRTRLEAAASRAELALQRAVRTTREQNRDLVTLCRRSEPRSGKQPSPRPEGVRREQKAEVCSPPSPPPTQAHELQATARLGAARQAQKQASPLPPSSSRHRVGPHTHLTAPPLHTDPPAPPARLRHGGSAAQSQGTCHFHFRFTPAGLPLGRVPCSPATSACSLHEVQTGTSPGGEPRPALPCAATGASRGHQAPAAAEPHARYAPRPRRRRRRADDGGGRRPMGTRGRRSARV